MLQCVAVWCGVLKCVAVCCSVLQCIGLCRGHAGLFREYIRAVFPIYRALLRTRWALLPMYQGLFADIYGSFFHEQGSFEDT